ncbi:MULTISPECIES: hypothetical protein [unclassified Actinobaculum]|uniref:hypothetical protein n=1 Tax=unclassified Actinobaculum TaxID=2609299 RepID=UPI000D5281C3|nr:MULTISPECIES: hypothetical protein [unclassified Actinobaculum]AWE42852.1 hypothetical protein DDD63_08980 [Actinobaculum sp. 313]RTE49068.1 hypothetical protein EKN07_08045 [Actinobaculum sp. 352]
MTDKWDGLLADGVPDIPASRRHGGPDRARRLPVMWGRVLVAVVVVGMVVAVIAWLWVHPTSSQVPDSATATTIRTDATGEPSAVPTWSYVTETAPVPEIAQRGPAVADEFLRLIYQSADWWEVDDQLADIATDQVRYELIEYPELHAPVDGAIAGIEYTDVTDTSAGTWSATAQITTNTGHQVTGAITAEATEDGWRVASWETAP